LSSPNPANVLDTGDPGDDTIARFKYQFCMVAINALRMIEDPDFAESIICENFEDLIIEKKDGKFVAVQVKTRARHRPQFKLTDEDVEKSLVRFMKLDVQFPGKFTEFQFVTNHELWTDKENGSNLDWFLKEIAANPKTKGLRKINPKRAAVDRLAEASVTSSEHVISVLLRTKCVSRREDVGTIERAVSDAITQCAQCADMPYQAVLKLADDLIAAAFQASSKGRNTLVAQLYAIDAKFEEVFAEASLVGKKIDRLMVKRIIEDRIKPEEELIEIAGMVNLDDLPNGLTRMVQKMAKGGVETIRIQHMTDLVRSLEALQVRWATKHGGERAKSMISDLLARTQTECVEAQVEVLQAGTPYGAKQYSAIKKRLETKHSLERGTLHGCKVEHMMGAAGVLTEECKVWWSEKFDLMEPDP
jgi:hypothetical protein